MIFFVAVNIADNLKNKDSLHRVAGNFDLMGYIVKFL